MGRVVRLRAVFKKANMADIWVKNIPEEGSTSVKALRLVCVCWGGQGGRGRQHRA